MEPDYSGADYRIGQAILGRWRIRSIAGGRGRSGMGVVYIAEDLGQERLVAIKTFQPEFVANERIRELIVQEANTWLAMGRHPHIVHVQSVEVVGIQPLIIMEYVAPDAAGRNCLADFLVGQPLETGLVARWALQICEALMHMRACGIEAHRDLKPDNVMVAADHTAKVTDFGLAHARLDPSRRPSAAGAPMAAFTTGGTPGYIAPEIFLGYAPDVRSDVYGFGLVLAQMITGERRTPLTGDRNDDLMAWERANLEIRRQSAPPTTSSPLHAIVKRCLRFEPAQRFEHFAALAQALRAVCDRKAIVLDAAPRRDAPASGAAGPDDDVGHALALHELGRSEEALARIRQLRREDPYDPALLHAEASVLSETGRPRRAIELLTTACRAEPDTAAHWLKLGRACRAAGESETALAQIDRAIALGDRTCAAVTERGACLLDLGRVEDALEAFEQALLADPHHGLALLGRAHALLRLGRLTESLAALERVFDVAPDLPAARELYKAGIAALESSGGPTTRAAALERADARLNRNDARGALEALREARFRFGDDTGLLKMEAALLTDLGDHTGAVRCCDRVLKTEPRNVEVLIVKASALQQLGEPQEAIEVCELATRAAPDAWRAWVQKSLCLADLKQSREALDSFARALTLARRHAQEQSCAAMAPDLDSMSTAESLLSVCNFPLADQFARAVSPDSVFAGDALQIGARAALGLASRLLEADSPDVDRPVHVLGMLERASLELTKPDERDAAQRLLADAVHRYMDEEFPRYVADEDLTAAERLLRYAARYAAADEERRFASEQLAIVLTNRAQEADIAQAAAARAWVSAARALAPDNSELAAVERELLGNALATGAASWPDPESHRAALAKRYASIDEWRRAWTALAKRLAGLGTDNDEADRARLRALGAAIQWLAGMRPAELSLPAIELRHACRLAACFGRAELHVHQAGQYAVPIQAELAPMLAAVNLCCASADIDGLDPRSLLAALEDQPEVAAALPEKRATRRVVHGVVTFDSEIDAPAAPSDAPVTRTLVPCAPAFMAAGLASSECFGASSAPPDDRDLICYARVRIGHTVLWMPASALATVADRALCELRLRTRGLIETVYLIY